MQDAFLEFKEIKGAFTLHVRLKACFILDILYKT